jgi:hypothetical protein
MNPITVTSPTTSNSILRWQPATWEDYLAYCEEPNLDEVRVFFNQGYLFDGKYQQCEYSVALEGLPISLIEQTLSQMNQATNVNAALWFAQQIADV